MISCNFMTENARILHMLSVPSASDLSEKRRAEMIREIVAQYADGKQITPEDGSDSLGWLEQIFGVENVVGIKFTGLLMSAGLFYYCWMHSCQPLRLRGMNTNFVWAVGLTSLNVVNAAREIWSYDVAPFVEISSARTKLKDWSKKYRMEAWKDYPSNYDINFALYRSVFSDQELRIQQLGDGRLDERGNVAEWTNV